MHRQLLTTQRWHIGQRNGRDTPRIQPRRTTIRASTSSGKEAGLLDPPHIDRFAKSSRQRGGSTRQNHGVVRTNVILGGKGPNVLYAQKEDRHEEGC